MKNSSFKSKKKNPVKNVQMNSDQIIELKIEKTLEFICPLYKNNLITDVYIVGSVAKGTADRFSDIDITLINPLFEIHPNIKTVDLPEIIESSSPNIKKIVDYFKMLGAEFKYLERNKGVSWHQLYEKELFHIMLTKSSEYIPKPNFQITKNDCQWFI